MKAIEKLREQLAQVGATLDDSGGYTLYCDAPAGYVWSANDCATLSIAYATNSQTWLTQAIKDATPDLAKGLRLASEEELADIRHSNDDDTIAAPQGAALIIMWPAK